MSIERSEVSPTLRSEAHAHEPVICYGFAHRQGSKAGSIAFRPEQSPTLRGGQFDATVLIAKEERDE